MTDCDQQAASIQRSALGILLEFDRFATENYLSYFLIGGTLLGAVRHQGFIPWDDDIDIALPREDYDRLLAMSPSFKGPYKLHSIESDSEFIYPYAKLYDTSTVVVEIVRGEFRRGVWVDIFPLDGSFCSPWLVKLQCVGIGCLKKLLLLKATASGARNIRGEAQFYLKLVLLYLMRPVSVRLLNRLLHRVLRLKRMSRALYAGNLLGIRGTKEVMRSCIYKTSESTTVQFCGNYLPAPSNPHEYLTALYGDYMTLPPLEERVPHKTAFVDLSKGYMDP